MAERSRSFDLDPSLSLDQNFVNEIEREKISVLSLKHCGLTDDHTNYLTELIKSSFLTRIDISFNSLSVHAIDRLLDALDSPPHRVTELEIAGMGTKHQRDRLRLLLLRNRKFNAVCDTHKLPDPSKQKPTDRHDCCVACAYSELIRKFEIDASSLKMSLEDQERVNNKLKLSLDETAAAKTQAENSITDLKRNISELSARIDNLSREKENAAAESRRLEEVVVEAKKREVALQSELRTEREQHRETRRVFDKERDEFHEKIHKLDEDVYERQEELAALRKTMSETELQLRKEISEHVAKAAGLSQQIAQVSAAKTTDSENHMAQIRALVTENMSLTETTDRMRRALTQSQSDLEAVEGRARHQDAEIARLRAALADKDEKLLQILDDNEKLKTELRNERLVWTERMRDLEAEMRDERQRRDSSGREILQVLKGTVERVTELINAN